MRAGSYHASPGGQELDRCAQELRMNCAKYCRLALLPGEGVEEVRSGGAAVAGIGAINSEDRHDRKVTMEFISNQIAMCGQPVRAAAGRPSAWQAGLPGYTGTGRASTSGACAAGFFGGFAVARRLAASLAACEVQRCVHAHVSRQYQRRSGQALPPSGTMLLADRRMPHSQHDRIVACSVSGPARWC